MGRWIPPTVLHGAWQMAIDEWCLDQAVKAFSKAAKPGVVVRLYRWARPTLSLGFHQRQVLPGWHALVARGAVDLVRRPSGGRAVLHGGDLTYALIWSDPPRHRREAYRLACRWLQEAFAELGLPLQFGRQAATTGDSSCFATSTSADLVHPCGAKRIGSAQLWRRGCLLQHGSILIEPPGSLWRQVFAEDPPALPGPPLALGTLAAHLRSAAERQFGADLPVRALDSDELTAIAARVDRYQLPG